MDENQRAFHAQQLLDNPVFQEALNQVNMGIQAEMDNVKPTDKEMAHALVMQRQAANRIYSHILALTESPKITSYNAALKKKRFSF